MMSGGCKRCVECTRRYACGMRHGEIYLPEMPGVSSVYYACRREMMRNTAALEGSNMIVIHFKHTRT